ncbi:nucleolar transcription factor 1-like isoform X2 [Saccoglossus kowalevskii]|uniref:Nucleolar transcription factor 1-like isoform X1 n=1 Tax=Saccoglossus kowalevskii TaxID=10224 RepID=A0ABM0GVS6_SACKO|nr:PREDICTED: nucleolar transcription factor 1-like isoform X1 [Saccoglossus kowalevskii]
MADSIRDREHLLPSGVKRKKAKTQLVNMSAMPATNSTGGTGRASKGRKRKVDVVENNGTTEGVSPGKKPKSVAKPGEWTTDQQLDLVAQVERQIPANDVLSFKSRSSKIVWENISCDNFNSDECKKEWTKMVDGVRKFRILKEICMDAKSHILKPPANKKYPDKPKKPLTPYFRFYLEKRQKILEENPHMSVAEISQVVAQRYKLLSEKKKGKYVKKYEEDMKSFEVEMQTFRDNHPDFVAATAPRAKKAVAPVKKSMTPYQIFQNKRVESAINSNPKMSKKEIEDLLKGQWKSMTDKKKMVFIRGAIEEFKQYEKAVVEYQRTHPDYEPKVFKSILTKAEQKIKDKSDGKPDRPPPNGYSLFCSILMNEHLSHIPSNERMVECSKRWKTLSQQEKDLYQERSNAAKKEFAIKYEEYLEKLPEEEREKLLKEDKSKQPRLQSDNNGNLQIKYPDRPKKPISAIFLFCNERKEKFLKDHPGMSMKEANQTLMQKYRELPEKKQEKYKKKEADMKSQYEKQMNEFVKEHPEYLKETQKRRVGIRRNQVLPKTPEELWIESKTEEYVQKNKVTVGKANEALKDQWARLDKASKLPWQKEAAKQKKNIERLEEIDKKILAEEPKKPPPNGYALYTREMLQSEELRHLENKSRIQEIARRWKMMPDQEKKKYKLKRDKLFKKFEELRDKFEKSLTQEELKRYKELSELKKGRRKVAVKAKVQESASESDSESASESDNDADSESESGSESEEEGSSSASSGSESEASEASAAVKPKAAVVQKATPVANQEESESDSDSASSESGSEESSSEESEEEEEPQPKTTARSKPQAKPQTAPRKRQGKQAESSESETSGEGESDSGTESESGSASDSSSEEE